MEKKHYEKSASFPTVEGIKGQIRSKQVSYWSRWHKEGLIVIGHLVTAAAANMYSCTGFILTSMYPAAEGESFKLSSAHRAKQLTAHSIIFVSNAHSGIPRISREGDTGHQRMLTCLCLSHLLLTGVRGINPEKMWNYYVCMQVNFATFSIQKLTLCESNFFPGNFSFITSIKR